MNVEFTVNAREDFEYWFDHDQEIIIKIKDPLRDIKRNPFQGPGKPEPLKYDLKGCWSKRIAGERRLVYKNEGTKGQNQKCYILQCRYHYDD